MRQLFNIQKIFMVCCFLTSAFLVPNLSHTHAQEIGGFTLSPTTNTINVEPGTSRTYSFSITNNENIETSLDIGIFETKNTVEILQDESSQVSSNWIKLTSPTNIVLNPSETTEIQYQVDIPQNVPQMLLQSTILIDVSRKASESDSYKFLIQIPYLINFIPAEELNDQSGNKLTVSKIESSLSILNKNSINFSVQNKMSENSYTKPIVYVQVLNPASIPIYSKILNEGARELVNSSELFFTEKFDIPAEILKDIGTYTVEIMAVDTLSEAVVVSKTSFTNIPYYYLGLAALLIVLIVKFMRVIRKKSKLIK